MPTEPAWSSPLLSDPHAVPDKRRRVREMFSAIAGAYDVNNRVHSLWRDQAWRGAAVRMAELQARQRVVDVACGTGDLTLAMARRLARFAPLRPGQVIGIDYTLPMLPIALRKKARVARNESVTTGVTFIQGDATALPLPDSCCDVVSIAFGIRNVQQPMLAVAEFRRVLRPGGRLIVLEFAEPQNRLIRGLDRLYREKLMPLTATLLSGDRSGAYRYLPRSVKTFYTPQQFRHELEVLGFTDVVSRAMTLGVCVCHRAVRA